jgi:hypothetical protein
VWVGVVELACFERDEVVNGRAASKEGTGSMSASGVMRMRLDNDDVAPPQMKLQAQARTADASWRTGSPTGSPNLGPSPTFPFSRQ